MTRSSLQSPAVLLALALLLPAVGAAEAQERVRRHDRPLTITKHTGSPGSSGIEVRNGGNEIVAWGGFSANGYGYGRMSREAANRAVRNDSVRARTAGLYGYGFDGLGGTGFDLDRNSGFDNPNYGNAYNSYVGYNGVPTAFAFGPAFANRHITDSDDDEDTGAQAPREQGLATLGGFDIDD